MRNNQLKKIKKILLISGILLLALVMFLIVARVEIRGNYQEENQSVKNSETNIDEGGQVDILEVPLDKLTEDETGMYYINSKNRVVFNGSPIDRWILSPFGKKAGFLENKDIFDKNIPYERQVILYVGNIDKRDFREIFHGSHRTSGWEWFNDDEIIVYYSCGTECQALYLANVDSGKGNYLIYGVNYEWSPNKELVLAYHYSWNYGITAGDKKGNVLLSIERSHVSNEDYSLIQKTKAAWSLDSERLALVIKKEKENKMELLVFNAKNNFKQIYKQDIDNADEYDLRWSEDGKSMKLNEKEIELK